MKDKITHKGIVESVNGGHVRVRIVQNSACSGCHAKAYCSSSDSKEKIIDVYNCDEEVGMGDIVTVVASTSMSGYAVVLAFVLPLVFMIATIVVCLQFVGLKEDVSALFGAMMLAAYWLLLFLNKDRISRKLVFRIEK